MYLGNNNNLGTLALPGYNNQRTEVRHGFHGLRDYDLGTAYVKDLVVFANETDLKTAVCASPLTQQASDFPNYFQQLIEKNQLAYGRKFQVFGIKWDVYNFKIFQAIIDTTTNVTYLCACDKSNNRWFYTPLCIMKLPYDVKGNLTAENANIIGGGSINGEKLPPGYDENYRYFFGWYTINGGSKPLPVFKIGGPNINKPICAVAGSIGMMYNSPGSIWDNLTFQNNTAPGSTLFDPNYNKDYTWTIVNCPASVREDDNVGTNPRGGGAQIIPETPTPGADTGACPCTKKSVQTTKSLYLSMQPTGNNVTPIILPVTRKVCKTTDNPQKTTKVDCNSVVAAFKQKFGQGV